LGGNIYIYISSYGSYRFIKKINNEIISALQIMYRNGTEPFASNVLTKEEYRNMGIAKELLIRAENYFKQKIKPSNDVNILGSKLVNSYLRTQE